jgi:hypothetical protein
MAVSADVRYPTAIASREMLLRAKSTHSRCPARCRLPLPHRTYHFIATKRRLGPTRTFRRVNANRVAAVPEAATREHGFRPPSHRRSLRSPELHRRPEPEYRQNRIGAAGDLTIVRPAAAARPEQVEMRRAGFLGHHPPRDKEHHLASRKCRRESTPQTSVGLLRNFWRSLSR